MKFKRISKLDEISEGDQLIIKSRSISKKTKGITHCKKFQKLDNDELVYNIKKNYYCIMSMYRSKESHVTDIYKIIFN